MARSEYIYIVIDEMGDIFGFTVKHEMVTWILKRADHQPLIAWRINDGLHKREAVELDLKALLC